MQELRELMADITGTLTSKMTNERKATLSTYRLTLAGAG